MLRTLRAISGFSAQVAQRSPAHHALLRRKDVHNGKPELSPTRFSPAAVKKVNATVGALLTQREGQSIIMRNIVFPGLGF